MKIIGSKKHSSNTYYLLRRAVNKLARPEDYSSIPWDQYEETGPGTIENESAG
jgi:hypothetical protein